MDRDHDEWVAAIVQAITTGTTLDLAPGEFFFATRGDRWPAHRQLPGQALRAALLKPDLKPDPRGLSIRAALITGEADLAEVRIPYSLRFLDCAFEQPVNWRRLTISGILSLAGCVTLSVNLDQAEIKGGAFLDHLDATGEVSALAATIGGPLDLQNAILTNAGGLALGLDGAEIRSNAVLQNFSATGEVRLTATHIGRQLNLADAKISNADQLALALDNAEINGHAFLDRIAATGEVRAVGAHIGGQLNMADAKISNADGLALNLEDVEIKDSALLTKLVATGAVAARGAKIGRQLSLDGASITNSGADALNLDDAEIKEFAILRNFSAVGAVRAIGVNIAGQLTLQGAKLSNEEGDALNLLSARLGNVYLTPDSMQGRLSLVRAQIDVLVVPDTISVLAANNLNALGWRLGDVRGAIRHDRRAAAEWLTSAASGKKAEFPAQPWHELASLYDRNGQPADARWLRLQAARGVTRTSPPGPRVVRWIYDALTGHGYYPLVAAVWLILAVLVTIGIVATHNEDFAPTATNRAAWKPDVPASKSAQPITGATPCDQLKDPSTCLNPVLWSFDNVLPGTLATGQAGLWTPNGAQGWNQWVPYTLGALKLFSWILVALLLAGVTGLLRKT